MMDVGDLFFGLIVIIGALTILVWLAFHDY